MEREDKSDRSEYYKLYRQIPGNIEKARAASSLNYARKQAEKGKTVRKNKGYQRRDPLAVKPPTVMEQRRLAKLREQQEQKAKTPAYRLSVLEKQLENMVNALLYTSPLNPCYGDMVNRMDALQIKIDNLKKNK